MNRSASRRRLEWEALEARLCPAVTGAAAYVQPVERTDSYAVQQHDNALIQVAAGRDQIALFGDSITEYIVNSTGASVWSSEVAPLSVADFGVASDTAENLLWRVEHGELDGDPKLAVVNIGTNDLGYGYSVNYTVAAIQAVVEEIQTLSPGTEVLLMGLFPRGATAGDSLRLEVGQVNAALAAWAPADGVGFLDIGPELTSPDGTLSTYFGDDDLHPNAAGYQVWDDAIQALLVDTDRSEATSSKAAATIAASVSAPTSTATAASTTVAASAGGIAGVTADGNVWHFQDGGSGPDPWEQLGAPGDAAAVVPSTNLSGQAELFAQLADDSVWVFDYATDTWTNTGGYLDRGTMIADSDGVIGIASGGTVFQYAKGLGWTQDGTLGNVASLVVSKDLSDQPELFGQLADGSVWLYHWDTGAWQATGGVLDPGTMVADSNGISGVAGGGTVYHYYYEYGWVRVGSLTGAGSLVSSWNLSGQEELFADMADGSVWIFDFATLAWTDTGGDFTAGTMIADSNGVSAIAGGTVYHFADGYGWIPIPSTETFVSVIDARDSSGDEVFFAQTSDGTLYEFSFSNAVGWTDDYGRLL